MHMDKEISLHNTGHASYTEEQEHDKTRKIDTFV